MGQASSMKQLPPQILAQVNFMLTEGKWTIDEIVDYLSEAGHPKSRSAIGRHKKNLDRVASKLRESREVTEALVKELGPDVTESKQGRLLTEILRTLVFKMAVPALEDGDDAPAFDPQDFFFLGKTLKELAQANRLDQDFEEKVRAAAEKKTKAAAAAAVEKIATEKGLSRKTVQDIKAQVLGVKVAP